MTTIAFPGIMNTYNEIVKNYQKLQEMGGAEQAAIYDKFPEAVKKYRNKLFGNLPRQIQEQLEQQPRYSAVRDAARNWTPSNPRLGRIDFRKKDETHLAYIGVIASLKGHTIEFLFDKTDEEAAREIRGALDELLGGLNEKC